MVVELKIHPLSLLHLLISLLLMAVTSFPGESAADHHLQHHHRRKRNVKLQPLPSAKPPTLSSWEQFKTLLNCKSAAPNQVHDPAAAGAGVVGRQHSKLSTRCGPSICSLRDVVHGSIRVDTDHNYSSGGDSEPLSAVRETEPLTRRLQLPSTAVYGGGSGASRGGMQLIRLSGCYECRAVDAEPASRRYPRTRTLCACPQCGEVFTKSDTLEIHQSVRHAVSELGPEDSGRNIVEIIFKSSWQKKDRPICMIERILKVHNATRTIARFEDYRNAVKSRALFHPASAAAGGLHPTAETRRNPRCAADGNELLRFHCASLSCQLGAAGATALCAASSAADPDTCGICTIIRHGFPRPHHPLGVRTTASSGRAHDHFPPPAAPAGCRRAMLVCRVIAGRVRYATDEDDGGGYDSVAGEGGECTNLEELLAANPRAILPCFVVIYRAMD